MKKEESQSLSLIEQAKLIKGKKAHKKFINEEEMELALAWAREELTLNQIMEVLVLSSQTQVYSFLAQCFKVYVNTEDKRNKIK
jgi:hypothetical protein